MTTDDTAIFTERIDTPVLLAFILSLAQKTETDDPCVGEPGWGAGEGGE